MQEITLFSLEKHLGEYQKWPHRTALYAENTPTGTTIFGYSLRAQYIINNDEYLIITDYDCPFEEAITVTLLNKNYEILAHVTLGAAYCSILFHHVEFKTDNHFILHDTDGYQWEYIIKQRKKTFWWKRTRLIFYRRIFPKRRLTLPSIIQRLIFGR